MGVEYMEGAPRAFLGQVRPGADAKVEMTPSSRSFFGCIGEPEGTGLLDPESLGAIEDGAILAFVSAIATLTDLAEPGKRGQKVIPINPANEDFSKQQGTMKIPPPACPMLGSIWQNKAAWVA